MAYIKTNWIINKTPINADNLNKIENQLETLTNLQDQLLDIFYPIGSYYETSDTSFDPNVTWGGTWAKDSKGRVTVALDDSDADFNTISKTGGEKTHALTKQELPKIDIKTYYATTSGGYGSGLVFGTSTGNSNNKLIENVNYGDQPHNNMQPFVVVVRWHRTA